MSTELAVLCRSPTARLLLRAPTAPVQRGSGSSGRDGHRLAVGAMATQEHSILEYEYTHHDAELLAQREAYLADHLQLCQAKADEGKLLLWGSVGAPVTGGMLIWCNTNEDEVTKFVKGDPFVVNGLVRHWTIKPFHVHVVGSK